MIRRLLLALPLAAAGALGLWFLLTPWPVTLAFRDPATTAFMRMRAAEAAADGRDFEIDYRPVPLQDIAPAMRRAVVVAEDGRFHEHAGIDWHAVADEVDWTGDDDFSALSAADWAAMLDALRYYRANSGKIRGRSTITQQLAKNLYFSEDRSLVRKLQELIVAKRLEWFLSKDRILELYLNTAEFGPGVFGVEAAAQHHFGVPASDLSRHQAASLAATLPHPLTSNPTTNPGRMAWRRGLILDRMGGTGTVETVPLAPADVEIDEPDVIGEPMRRVEASRRQPEPEPAAAPAVEPQTEPAAEPPVEPEPPPVEPVDTTGDPPAISPAGA